MGSSPAEEVCPGTPETSSRLPGGDARSSPPDARPLLVESLEEGQFLVVVLDREGRIHWANRAFRRALVEGRGEWDGRFPSLLSKESASLLPHVLPLQAGDARTAEMRHPVSAGLLTIFYQFFPAPDGRIIAIGSDRTEEKELIAQMSALVDDLNQEVERRAELSRRLEELARTDSLTGVANRREFDEVLKQEWGRMRRYGSHFALILLDIDHFKEVNDRHGHQAGDEVLRKIARILKRAVRSEDIVARYGGEEFAVIALAADLDRGRDLGDRLRLKVAGAAMPGGIPRVTVSAGVASTMSPEPPRDIPDLISRADGALYRAKASGRNRVETA